MFNFRNASLTFKLAFLENEECIPQNLQLSVYKSILYVHTTVCPLIHA